MKKLVYLLIGILCIGCGSKNISVKSYYFPYPSLTTPKVYSFIDTNNNSQRIYWHLRTEIQNTDTILGIHVFNDHLQLIDILFNQITQDGVILKKVIHMSPYGQLNYTINEDNVLEWNSKPGDKRYVSFGISDSTGEESQDILIEKSINDKKADVSFDNKIYSCLVVNELTTLSIKSPNRTKTEEQLRTGYYARGIGLIRFETYAPDGAVTTMTLEKIMELKDFEMLRLSKKDSTNTIH